MASPRRAEAGGASEGRILVRSADDYTRGDKVEASGTRPAAKTARSLERDIVDEAGEGSFPSSDPPSWTRALAS
jgi:hypothetical protein